MKKLHLTHILLPSLLLCATACNDNAIVEQTPDEQTPGQTSREIHVNVAGHDLLSLRDCSDSSNGNRVRHIGSYPIGKTRDGILTLVCLERPMGSATPDVDITASRAVPVTNDNFASLYGMFRMAGYPTGTASNPIMPLCNVVYDATASYYKWVPDSKPSFYPSDGSGVDFWAYAPATLGTGCGTRSTVAFNSSKASFHYDMPAHTSDNKDAEHQKDLIMAGVVNQSSGDVNLVFNHTLSAIKFQTIRIPDGKIRTVSIKGIANAGTCTYDPQSTTTDADGYVTYCTWALDNTTDSYTQTFNKLVSSSDTTALTDEDPKTTFIVVPQKTPKTAYMEIEFEYDQELVAGSADERVQKFIADIGGTEWRPGYEYLYNIITIPFETANCYIAETPGLHLVPAFCMGNRQDQMLTAPSGHEYDVAVLWSDCGLSGGSRADGSAVSQDAVTDLSYFTMDDGKSYFIYRVGEDASGNPIRGNVVVALYDKDATAPETGKPEIIWTWHIWLTEEPETTYTDGGCDIGTYETTDEMTGQKYTFMSDATDGPLAIMDRNLGAISADPADGWKTFGLYYQNGRRDPFIGGGTNTGSPNVTGLTSGTGTVSYEYQDNKGETKTGTAGDGGGNTVYYNEDEAFDPTYSTRTYWNDALSDGWETYTFYGTDGTAATNFDIPWSIHEPMTFSGNTAFGMQWTAYADGDNQAYMDVRVKSSGVHGNTGLYDIGHQAYWSRYKTIMDPCPAGWTILGDKDNNNVWGNGSKGTGIYFDNNPKTRIVNGIYGASFTYTYSGATDSELNGTTFTSWWPAAGVRATNGRMSSVGYQGFYLYYDHVAANHGGHGMYFTVGATDGGNVAAYGNGITTNHATPVRCVRAKQDVPNT